MRSIILRAIENNIEFVQFLLDNRVGAKILRIVAAIANLMLLLPRGGNKEV